MLQKSSHDDIGDDDDGVSANVRNLVSLFENRRKSTKSTDQFLRPDDEDAKCENVIISPPLEFEDSLHLTSSSSSVTVSSKPRSRTDFISDILKLGGAGGGEETGAGAGEGEGGSRQRSLAYMCGGQQPAASEQGCWLAATIRLSFRLLTLLPSKYH